MGPFLGSFQRHDGRADHLGSDLRNLACERDLLEASQTLARSDSAAQNISIERSNFMVHLLFVNHLALLQSAVS